MLMRVLLLVVLAIATVFVALNWGTIVTPTTISLGFTSVQAPLGLVLVGLMAIITALFLAFIVYLQMTVVLEMRANAREMRSQRELAEQAEASRFTELREFVASETERLRSALQQTENSLAADIGELRNRIDAAGPGPGAPAG